MGKNCTKLQELTINLLFKYMGRATYNGIEIVQLGPTALAIGLHYMPFLFLHLFY